MMSAPGKFFHQPQVANLVADVERRYGFVKQSMTSWVGSSVTAFLEDSQITALLSDPQVQQVSQDTYSSLSAPMPWNDFNTGAEIYGWSRTAVNGKSASPYSTRKIYVIDSGVAHHTDFSSNQVVRTNVHCGSAGGCEYEIPAYWSTTPYPAVGCYGHAAHVAGIIAAPINNTGVAGVYAGAKLISLNVTNVLGNASNAEL